MVLLERRRWGIVKLVSRCAQEDIDDLIFAEEEYHISTR